MSVLLKLIFALFEVITLAAVKETGRAKVNGLAPETVIFPPIWIKAPFVKIIFVKAVVVPTVVRLIEPPDPPFTVNACAPLRVLEKEILAPAVVPPAFVVSRVTAPVKETGPIILMLPPLVVILLFKVINVDPV